MKLGFISDLHLDINAKKQQPDLLAILLDVAKEKNIDALCIGGDITDYYKTTLATIGKIEKELSIPCYFIPGNHDLWNIECPTEQTWHIYDELKKHPRNLANGPQLLTKEWVLIGDIGWYDFSFGCTKKYTIDDFKRMKLKGGRWKDKEYTDWANDSLITHQYFLDKLEKALTENKGKKIIMCTHVVSHRKLTVPGPHRIWDYFNAYLGSSDYGKLAQDFNVRYALCGHVHYRRSFMDGATTFICSCLGYKNEWRFSTPKQEVNHALTVIEID